MRSKFHVAISFLGDFLLVAVLPYLALYIRLEGQPGSIYYAMLAPYVLPMAFITVIVFYCCGLYNRLWRYAGIHEILVIFYAVTVSTVINVLLLLGCHAGLPRSLPIMSWLLNLVLVGAGRFGLRVSGHFKLAGHSQIEDEERIIIIGAGDTGAALARTLQVSEGKKRVIGFIDDDPAKFGKQLYGAKVLGDRNHMKDIILQYGVDEAVIALSTPNGEVLRELIRKCQKTHCRVKRVPSIMELLNGKMSIEQLRDVNVEDLLQRETVRLDLTKIDGYLTGKRVLITGAGGSIGSELCRQIALRQPALLVLVGKGENSIYEIEQELKMKFPKLPIEPVIGDIRDARKMETVFERLRPETVFHAAAHKHVPLMERYPEEAVATNIFGTKNVAEAASKVKTSVFVMISTDKAVNPTSVMGATKRIAEQVIQWVGKHSTTKFVTVRFGNVLRSRGSVIPLFEKQIAAGGPVTVTHPEMTRYFMTIPEAVQLVLEAGSMARGGEVFLLDMGEPVKIYDLACSLIELAGLRPGKDIEIRYTGLRPGEKLYEELMTAEEGNAATKNQKIFRAQLEKVDEKRLMEILEELSQKWESDEIKLLLESIVPHYQPSHANGTKQEKLA